ncbi:hypothetical protein IE077_004298 [Cardiosporidium cionae]|uniref:Uncharacterized protein n=1 Tax=Cardiosporidium cionae TaxID=476202 RepID=A0ABQ7JCB8_9APIC|nr:hypothetical protein IE077_004298 [Cardiosporidium cionae]|eukprot:KAF8821678.1 hypothetical protein IE077_004298 [Cardiosporidium cionae]
MRKTFADKMMPFTFNQPPPKEYISPFWRTMLRSVGFVALCVAIAKYGEYVDMPENWKLA